ncbi:SNF2 family N-terminal domain-containing protein [Boeremia exigua]|uniref:SNF2 family N-terminal domain-containing protein n=1 Tax=Boeremia exigua TaxID=749465 RepID=UPI001E8CDF8E|nr:SNF2 family N-terminal domain-containing protein [Boeremia exigua]KAH6633407.1 SNF2 family N-terminal domain-containing protein [Boeremia exigua]
MNSGSQKHRAPFAPLNTLTSSQEPAYAPLGTPESSFYGDSSSLFDEASSPFAPSPYIPPPSTQSRMVREREPSALPPRPEAQKPAPSAAMQERIAAPQFGQASPLRNPLRQDKPKHAHLFNIPKPGQPRPEHHQTTARIPNPQALPTHKPHQSSSAKPAAKVDAFGRPIDDDLFEIPASSFQPRPSASVPVPRPFNPPAQTMQPPPRSLYSSIGHGNGFQPVNRGAHNPLQEARKTIILDDEDDFDPDGAVFADRGRFGAPDLDAYVDQAQASENIKALLEGALDEDEEKIPRTRGRKKKKQEAKDATKSLADRLKGLGVEDKEPEPEPEEPEAEDDEDDGFVDGLKVSLLPHQVDGVSWMIEKETGAHNKRGKLPKGGILADDMGLGKTVQSMALILSNPRPEKGAEPENKKNKILDIVGKGTLVVAPLALIKQWESEINTKVAKTHALKVLVHHGPNRTKSADKLKQYDVVITTYQVLASEHAQCGDGPDGLKKGCFAVHWYRMMLDEAHTIKNRNAKMTKACYEVRSHYRWCLTGTPMQNNLDELQSLIKFLRIQPYCEMSAWKDSITGPMKNGRGNLAMRRLQIFLKAFMKRRTKDVLKKDGALTFGGKGKDGAEKPAFQIVERNVETVIGEFTAKERAFYDRLSTRAQDRLEELMGGAKQDYIGALVLLLRLRQACNHPNLTKSNVKDDKDALTTGSKQGTQTEFQTPRKGPRGDDADDLADLLGGLSVATKRCDLCQRALNRDNAANGSIRCHDCEEDLNASTKKMKKHKKKHRKDKHRSEKTKKSSKTVDPTDDDDEDEEDVVRPSQASRQRRVIVDSDDEEEEGEWLVPEDQQQSEDLGVAGGTDDEDAEGGGDTLASIDSQATGSVDDSKSNLDSFIVHDTDSEDEAPIVRKKLFTKEKPRIARPVSDREDGSTTEAESESGSEDEDEDESATEESDSDYNASDLVPSTKIRQLLQILEKETPDHKVIVFSQFTSMLDLIEPFLKRANFVFTRYDGSMRNDLREASLHKLREDKRTRVLLCSLKCGSLGLNLTAASRVVIMEPFWNPFVEEQAIDRVHRLNQTVDVTVYRLSIHNSVEERILELQEAKRKLAQAAIEGGKAIGKLSMKDILNLFKREAEYDHTHMDAGPEQDIFTKRRVLEQGAEIGGRGESTAPKPARKAGSLGFRKERKEDTVYGRR